MSTITAGDWTLLYDPAPGQSELYYVKNDPAETLNVISEHPDVARELHRIFVQFMQETKVPERLFKPRIDLRIA